MSVVVTLEKFAEKFTHLKPSSIFSVGILVFVRRMALCFWSSDVIGVAVKGGEIDEGKGRHFVAW